MCFTTESELKKLLEEMTSFGGAFELAAGELPTEDDIPDEIDRLPKAERRKWRSAFYAFFSYMEDQAEEALDRMRYAAEQFEPDEFDEEEEGRPKLKRRPKTKTSKPPLDYVKLGYRRNPVLAEIGKELTDEGFNALLGRAWKRINSGSSLAELFQEEVTAFMEWFDRDEADPAESQAGRLQKRLQRQPRRKVTKKKPS